jgi:hypothetical protein
MRGRSNICEQGKENANRGGGMGGRAGEEALGQIRDRLKVRAREKNSKNDEDLRHA